MRRQPGAGKPAPGFSFAAACLPALPRLCSCTSLRLRQGEMLRQHDLITSQAMDRRMHLWRYGHYGMPLIVFPSASGMAHEWDAHGVIDSLGDLIDRGRLKLYCTESNVAEAWTRKESDPSWRIKKHQAFERYVVSELVPFIRADCHST